ncbi:hypothetical protein Ae201684P_007609 [Aphanomyces euteiches]|uniref:Uncharacterized protein n=1 Tax=Aphanomyces euteiches TaxID=100861 RepID=A0A6G0WEK8_9STRA|nr:hypothetical protein Ae201684_016354 [Aphanomyces euteiches]KAH9079900.1 hypothetical protein Ae201684P_007609 [Aphanomyces euteiches]
MPMLPCTWSHRILVGRVWTSSERNPLSQYDLRPIYVFYLAFFPLTSHPGLGATLHEECQTTPLLAGYTVLLASTCLTSLLGTSPDFARFVFAFSPFCISRGRRSTTLPASSSFTEGETTSSQRRQSPQTEPGQVPQASGTPSLHSTDTDFQPNRPGPAAHSPRSELHNQGLHITQLNLRISDQGRHLERADIRIQELSAEVDRLTQAVALLSASEGRPRRCPQGPPCGMLTRRGTPCANPLASCVHRAVGRHLEQKHQAHSDNQSTTDDESDHL